MAALKLDRHDDRVVLGVASVILHASAIYFASESGKQEDRVQLSAHRAGGVPEVEAWRNQVRTELRAQGVKAVTMTDGTGVVGCILRSDAVGSEWRERQHAEIEAGMDHKEQRQAEIARGLPGYRLYREQLPADVVQRLAGQLAKLETGYYHLRDLLPA